AGAGVAIGFGWFGTGATLAVTAAFGDIIDGLLARKMNLSSDTGELVDAPVDRYGEMFFFGGLVYYYRDHDQVLFLVLAAFIPLASALFANSPSLALREAPILLALSVVAVVANISVVQRLLAIATLLREREATKKSVGRAPFDDEAMTTKPDAPVGTV